MAAPRSASGITPATSPACFAAGAGHEPGSRAVVGDHDGEDQDPLQDDEDLGRKVGSHRDAVLPPQQHAEEDRRQWDTCGVISTQERDPDPGEAEALLVVRSEKARVSEDVVEPHESRRALPRSGTP